MRRILGVIFIVLLAAQVAWGTASYPTSVKTYTTKIAGQVIQAAHINDLQDEVVAIEDALLNGSAHSLIPSTTRTRDLGSAALLWRDLNLGRTLTVTQGTITTDLKALDVSGTWNAAGVTFTAIKANITDTASAAASLLEQLQVGGINRRTLGKDGLMTLAGSGASIDLTAGVAAYIGTTDAFNLLLKRAGVTKLTVGASAVTLADALAVGSTVASAGAIRLPTDTFINWRNAANTADVGIYAHGGGWFEVGQHWAPSATNLYDLGAPGSTPITKWRRLHISQDIRIYGQGASPNMPTTIGFTGVYLVNDSGFIWRNAGNTADISMFLNTSDELEIHAPVIITGATLKIGTTPATGGALALANAAQITARNAANTANVNLLTLNASDRLVLSPSANDIQWGVALVALGGGAAPTFGTIGGSGPTVAGQNSWMRVLDSTGAAFWVPAWK